MMRLSQESVGGLVKRETHSLRAICWNSLDPAAFWISFPQFTKYFAKQVINFLRVGQSTGSDSIGALLSLWGRGQSVEFEGLANHM